VKSEEQANRSATIAHFKSQPADPPFSEEEPFSSVVVAEDAAVKPSIEPRQDFAALVVASVGSSGRDAPTSDGIGGGQADLNEHRDAADAAVALATSARAVGESEVGQADINEHSDAVDGIEEAMRMIFGDAAGAAADLAEVGHRDAAAAAVAAEVGQRDAAAADIAAEVGQRDEAAPAIAAEVGQRDAAAAAVGHARGCRAAKKGISSIELAKTNRSFCKVCSHCILRNEVRFGYRHSKAKPLGYIHVECVVGCPDPRDLIADLMALRESNPALTQAVSNAWAVLQAC
jgi:hypothetical protein